jgi:hypothetical protein
MTTHKPLLLYHQLFSEHAHTPATVTVTVCYCHCFCCAGDDETTKAAGRLRLFVSFAAQLREHGVLLLLTESRRAPMIQWRSQATILSEPAYSPCPCMCTYTYTFFILHLCLLYLTPTPTSCCHCTTHTALHCNPYTTKP